MTVASAAFAAPHATAMKEVQQAGLGSGYGASGSSVFQVLKWPGNKRAVLTKITLSDLYEAGGVAISPASVGLAEVHAAFIVGSPTSNVLPNNTATAAARGVPTVDVTTSTAPKVKVLIGGADVTATTDVSGFVFHVVLIGI